jgi:hypothetical protein
MRKKAVAKGAGLQEVATRQGVLQLSLVSGAMDMKLSQFLIWNFFAGAAFVLSVGPAAYGTGQVSTGHHNSVSLGMLIGGLAVGAVCVLLAMRYYRRHKARQSAAGTPPGPAKGQPTGRDPL